MSNNSEEWSEEDRLKQRNALFEKLRETLVLEYPPEDDGLSRTITLTMTMPEVLRRLRIASRGITFRKFPVGRDYLTIQSPRFEDRYEDELEAPPVVTLDGMLHQHDGGRIIWPRLVSFTLHERNDASLFIKAECTHPDLIPTRDALITGLEK
jgi:hypothetical protein